jgi:hypothetical protein
MLIEKMPKNAEIFVCKKCDFSCSKLSNFNKHILTLKHERLINTNKKCRKMPKKFLCKCGKEYIHQSSLCKHKKKCKYQEKIDVVETDESVDETYTLVEKSETTELKNLVKTLVDENKELTKTIRDLAPKVGSNNNNSFNLNIFLNEQCKDAMNISDFVQSLQIEFDDLETTRTNGVVEGLSNIIVKGLKELDTCKRPIHCTDMKRETLYIKDNNEWEKEKDKGKITSVIDTVASKQMKSIKEWENKNPNWIDYEHKQQEYLKLVNSVMGYQPDDYNHNNKIIKNIAKEVTIDK